VPSADTLRHGISIVAETLVIDGTPNPDHIRIMAAGPPGWLRVIFDGIDLGTFGPVARILVRAGDGDDVVAVEPQVTLPTRLEGGTGDDCLQGGSGPDVLFGGDGDDTLVGTRGRDALHAGQGSNAIVFATRIGEIRVTRSAEGALLRHLATAYTLRGLPLGNGTVPGSGGARPSPIILGPPDLGNPRIAPLLREAYEAGEAIALTNATRADAAALRTLLGHPAGADGPMNEPAALTFFRRVPRRASQVADYSSGIVLSPSPQLAYRRDPHPRTIELLSRVFSATAIVPEPPRDSPENNLLQIANSYSSSMIATNSSDDQIQLTNLVWNVRSFDQQQDLYYVLQEVDYYQSPSHHNAVGWGGLAGNRMTPASSTIQTSPASTHCVTSTTSGVSYTAGARTGWNQLQGLDAALSGGVTISNSKTTTCPAVTIENRTDPNTAETAWTYGAAFHRGQLQTFYNQWIWTVPFANYATGQSTVQFSSDAALDVVCFDPLICGKVTASLQATIPMPFGDVFALQQPVVLNVTPTCVNAGDVFTIAGAGLYPSLVASVLIGGSSLNSSQYTTTSDTAIQVVAPEVSGSALAVVVQTTQGDSNDNVTLEISIIDICNLEAGLLSD
jgi:hypothetical protein